MQSSSDILIYGPAYLDLLVEVAGPLFDVWQLDQSLPALSMSPADDGAITVMGMCGDYLRFHLPESYQDAAAIYETAEPVLARVCGGAEAARHPVCAEYAVAGYSSLVGGMGAGYALATGGMLRMPLGGGADEPDAVGAKVLRQLAAHGVRAVPAWLPGVASDSSLVILSPQGDKLAIGVREAMVQWRPTAADRALVAAADVLIFCGAPNALVAEVMAWRPDAIVMCAPALRNVTDTATPLAEIAAGIHYLTLNALEWTALPEAEALREMIPVITVTDGSRGSRVLLGLEEVCVRAEPFTGQANTNRAGETYGATFLKVLLRVLPNFPHAPITHALAHQAAVRATRQATRQLALSGFAFPDDD